MRHPRKEELAKLKVRGREKLKVLGLPPLQELYGIGDMAFQPQPNGSQIEQGGLQSARQPPQNAGGAFKRRNFPDWTSHISMPRPRE